MLQRKPKTAKIERLRKRDNEEFAILRRKAARWSKDNFEKLTDPDPKIPEALNDRAADNWRPLLAIADLAGGEWPKRAREAAHTSLARIIRTALSMSNFCGTSAWRSASADLVAALTTDPERPWATWRKGDKPLTQNALARLLKPFRVISETVHPIGRPDAKGYKRVWFEDLWAGYLSGQNPSPQQTPIFKASSRPNVAETGITRDFQNVQKALPDALKNGNLSYSHAASDAWTDQKSQIGAESDSATNGSATNGNSRPPLCDHCGRPGKLNPWDWDGRPDGIVLHSSCEGPWFDSEGGRLQ